jgi:hypothetical protein
MKTSTPPVFTPVTPEEISRRAREIWLERGSPEGQDVEIWLLAERELSAPPASSASSGKAPKASRKARAASTTKTPAASDAEVIDVGELQDRLTRFGESPQRSPTSLDLS